jgi:hypothetical protein
LPVRDRAESLAEIDEALDRITAAAKGGIAGLDARRIAGGGGGATRIRARLGGVVHWLGAAIAPWNALKET